MNEAGRMDSAADVQTGERVEASQCDPGTTGSVGGLYESGKYFTGKKNTTAFSYQYRNGILLKLYLLESYLNPGPSYVNYDLFVDTSITLSGLTTTSFFVKNYCF